MKKIAIIISTVVLVVVGVVVYVLMTNSGPGTQKSSGPQQQLKSPAPVKQ